jgi:hypothetical protein
MAGIFPRPQLMRLRDRWVMAIPVAFALLFAVGFGLFSVGAITAAPRAAADVASLSSEIAQTTVSVKLSPDWRPASGPDHTCDVCNGHHGGLHHPNYCHNCIDAGDTPVIPDYGHHHGR